VPPPGPAVPAPLRAIAAALDRPAAPASTVDALRAGRSRFLARLRAEVPAVEVEADGEIVHLGALSPGCRACKAGAWDCLFLTLRCNLRCGFCLNPQVEAGDLQGSAFGREPEEIARNHARTDIRGISFSGGEPLLERERLFEWVAFFRQRRPDAWLWAYTHGLLATEDDLRTLGALGLDEIRFNTAATGYAHAAVLENLAHAARHVPHVTVEIPAIPEDLDRLLGSLDEWAARGVRFLNLHELLYEPGTPSAQRPGPREPVVLADGHLTAIDPGSREVTLAVMKEVQRRGLPLAVNDCSLQGKLRQLEGRRRSLMPLTRRPWEEMQADTTLVSYVLWQSELEFERVHPARVDAARRDHPSWHLARLSRRAPRTLDAAEDWLSCEQLF
jgi:pyruvate formate-lyase activating enzyme-like uncharacterized protein